MEVLCGNRSEQEAAECAKPPGRHHVLQLAAEGRANKEIAVQLHISLTTVETHRTHILQKLNLHSLPALILYAVRKAIIS